jgi:hypothetical protein
VNKFQVCYEIISDVTCGENTVPLDKISNFYAGENLKHKPNNC